MRLLCARSVSACGSPQAANCAQRRTRTGPVSTGRSPSGHGTALRRQNKAGSSPARPAEIGQMVDQRFEAPRVDGSSPSLGTASAVLRFSLPASSGSRGSGQIGKASPSHGENCEFKSRLLHAFESVAAAANLPTASGCASVVQVLEEQWSRKPQVASSSLAASPVEMTGLTTTAINERVAERQGTALQKQNNMGPNPIAFSGRIESRECSRGVVQRNGFSAVARETRVQPSSPLPLKRQDDDTRCQRAEKQLSQRRLYRSV